MTGPVLALLLGASAPVPGIPPGFQRVTSRGTAVPLEVEGGSYGDVRRALLGGGWPAADAVQVDELVNHFGYDYSPPEGLRPLAVTTEVARCPWNPAHALALIGIQGRLGTPVKAAPRRLVFLVDVGGSMRRPGRLPLVKAALRAVAGTLGPQDQMAIVVYGAGQAGVALPPSTGSLQGSITRAITDLEVAPPRSGRDGASLAYELAGDGPAHVLLVTDGDFQVGLDNPADLGTAAERGRARGVDFSVLAVGMGDLRYETMQDLATRGGGKVVYVDGVAEARRAFMAAGGGQPVAIALNVGVTLRWNPRRVGSFRLLGSAAAPAVSTLLPEMPPGHTVTVLYELAPPSDAPGEEPGFPRRGREPLFELEVRYKEPDLNKNQLFTVPVAANAGPDRPSRDLRFATAVVGFAQLLRREPQAAGWDLVSELARSSVEPDPGGHRAEFLDLVARARALAEAHPPATP